MPLAFCARAQPMSAELTGQSARAFLPFLPNSDLEGDNKRGSERAPGASRATESLSQVSTHVHSTAQLAPDGLWQTEEMCFWDSNVHINYNIFILRLFLRGDVLSAVLYLLSDLDMCAGVWGRVLRPGVFTVSRFMELSERECGEAWSCADCTRRVWTVLSHQPATQAAQFVWTHRYFRAFQMNKKTYYWVINDVQKYALYFNCMFAFLK